MIRESLSLDDVLLVPQYSEIESRSDVDIGVELPKGFGNLWHPLVPSNMKTIVSHELAKEQLDCGGMAIMHRFTSFEQQLKIFKDLHQLGHLGVSVGIKEMDKKSVDRFIQEGVNIFCIDVAHGHSAGCIAMTKYIATKYPGVLIISGNVATADGAQALWEAGADIVKVNVGSGSICSTRIQTGNGVPVMTSLMDVYNRRQFLQRSGSGKFKDKLMLIMNDGGVKNSGDCVKALCFADLLMCGNVFSGCQETPGENVEINGKTYKRYDGSSTHKDSHVEGVKALVPAKGKFKDILKSLHEGIKSGCSYQGVDNLLKLKENPEFIKISHAGMIESRPHDVLVMG